MAYKILILLHLHNFQRSLLNLCIYKHYEPGPLYNYQPYSRIIEGGMLSDAIAVMASANIVAGELDR